MQNFQVGQEVKCINTGLLGDNKVAPPLNLNQNYKIKLICLDKENNQHLDVGLNSGFEYVRSIETGEELPRGDKIHWCHPSRFELIV